MIHLKGSAYITFCLQLKDVNARLLFNLFCSLCGAMFHPQFERSHRRAPYSIVFYRGLPGSRTECGRRSGTPKASKRLNAANVPRARRPPLPTNAVGRALR